MNIFIFILLCNLYPLQTTNKNEIKSSITSPQYNKKTEKINIVLNKDNILKITGSIGGVKIVYDTLKFILKNDKTETELEELQPQNKKPDESTISKESNINEKQYQQNIIDLNNKINDLNNENNDLNNENISLNHSINQYKKTSDNAENNYKTTDKQLKKLNIQYQQLIQENQIINDKNQMLQQTIKESNNSNNKEILDKINDYMDIKNQLNEVNEKNKNLQSEYEKNNNLLQMFKKNNRELELKIKEINDQQKNISKENNGPKNLLKNLGNKFISKIDEEINSLIDKKNEYYETIAQLNQIIQESKITIETLKKYPNFYTIEKYEQLITDKNLINEQINNLQSNILENNKIYQEYIKEYDAFQSVMNSIKIDIEEKDKLENLKNKMKNQLNIIIKKNQETEDALKKSKEIADQLNNDTGILQIEIDKLINSNILNDDGDKIDDNSLTMDNITKEFNDISYVNSKQFERCNFSTGFMSYGKDIYHLVFPEIATINQYLYEKINPFILSKLNNIYEKDSEIQKKIYYFFINVIDKLQNI